jgi:hypothetical protein
VQEAHRQLAPPDPLLRQPAPAVDAGQLPPSAAGPSQIASPTLLPSAFGLNTISRAEFVHQFLGRRFRRR